MPVRFTIGEFSKVTGLTVKTLRFYHDEGLLSAAFVDPATSYRYYDLVQVETARLIAHLRALEFPLAEIKELLRHRENDEELLAAVRRQKATLEQKIRHFKAIVRTLEQFISAERQVQAMSDATFDVQEKALDRMLIAGVRMKGRYNECGKGFAKIGRAMGRHICGAAFLLHYDQEYKEDDADFEACMPVKQAKMVEGIDVRELPGGRCVWLVYKGPYGELGRAYAKILQYAKDKGYLITTPTREVYMKGPGMIFKGNPRNYLTEIQLLVSAPATPT